MATTSNKQNKRAVSIMYKSIDAAPKITINGIQTEDDKPYQMDSHSTAQNRYKVKTKKFQSLTTQLTPLNRNTEYSGIRGTLAELL